MLNILPNEQPQETLPAMKKHHELAPTEYFLNIAKKIKDENESERSKINARAIIQMCRRHRNKTPGDAFGFWNDKGTWCETPSFATLHNVPMFQQLVEGAAANFLQADVRLDIKAKTKEFKHRAVERIAKDIYTVLNEEQWNESNKAQAFYAKILKLNAYYISRFNKDKGDEIPVPKFDEMSYEMGGSGVCTDCYQPTDIGGDGSICQHCGGNVAILDAPQSQTESLVPQFDTVKTGAAEMIVADGLSVSTDPQGRSSDISTCKWVEYRPDLINKAELKRVYPHLKIEGRAEWSYHTRLKQALMRFQSGEYGPSTDTERELYEMRIIWLDVTEYEDYCAPSDLKLGQDVLLTRGGYLKDVYPDGIVLGLIGQEIAFIDGENKNKRIKASHWIADPNGFEGIGAKAGLAPCRTANMLLNVATEGEFRSVKGSILYHSEAINGNDLEGANLNIPTKPDFLLNNRPLSDFVLPLKVEGLTQETLALMALMKQHAQEAMGIPDVILGQDTAEDPTFGGQALRTRNALGLLTPKVQSQARAKEGWLYDQLDIIQTYYSPEALRQFGARSGSEWLDDEIQAFFDADIEKAVSVQYIQGTEVPESRFEKQQRLRMDIGAGFIPLTPELQAQLAQESNYDAPDINNYESNLRLAEKRYRFVGEIVPQAEQLYEMFAMQMQGAVGPDGAPLPNPVIMQLLSSPEMKVYELTEDHDQQMNFWSQKVRDLNGSQTASPLQLELCNAMVQQHFGMRTQVAVTENAQMGMAQAAGAAPQAVGQAMLQQATEDPKKAVSK